MNVFMPDLVVSLVFITYAIVVLLSFGGLLTWVERKQAAVMSDRIGANRAYIKIPFTNIKLVWLGLFHGMADGLKMLLKENFKPKTHDGVGYFLAPFIVFTPVLLVFAEMFAPSGTPQGGWTDRRLPIMALLIVTQEMCSRMGACPPKGPSRRMMSTRPALSRRCHCT